MPRSLVTGAGHRLGRAIALYLAGRGHSVAVHYAHSAAGAQDTVDQIVAMGGTAHALQADLLDEDAAEALLPRAAEILGGPITCLINNASIFEDDSLTTATKASWDRHMGSNLRAPFVLSQAMAAQNLAPVIENNEPVATGLIVNMIDQRVRKLTPHYMTYTIAKAGLWAMTQTTARALAPAVRVNGIGPGPTLKGADQTDAGYAKQRSATVLQRGANPADITAAIGYLLDAPAVTGQLLCVDGGQHLAWETPDVIGTE
jgi:NAD(P)-dependent dehydrogenase (short-subunit alcohol dehydrogenase family)